MKRILTGIVVSSKMDKTVVVEVKRSSRHPVYHKIIVTTKKYAAHDENNTYTEGSRVTIRESRPISKTKTWEVIGLDSGEKI